MQLLCILTEAIRSSLSFQCPEAAQAECCICRNCHNLQWLNHQVPQPCSLGDLPAPMGCVVPVDADHARHHSLPAARGQP